MWGNLNLSAKYCIAEEGIFINAPCPLIVPANKYLLAVLNSKLADYYIRSLGVTRNGGYFEYKPMFIERLPVPIIYRGEQEKMGELVDVIIKLKNKKIETTELENKVNSYIFNIYGMEQQEVDFIEKLIL